MKLFIDIGNTRTKYVTEDQKLSAIGYIANAQLSNSYLDTIFTEVDEVIVANVQSNNLANIIAGWAESRAIPCAEVHSEAKAFGVTSSYREPATLGIDRWLVLIGTRKLFPQDNVLIIDAGTATTFDYLDNKGQHLGGWIMPGIHTMLDSLHVATEKVRASSLPSTSLDFGENTNECVNYGCWAMASGAIKQAIIEANKIALLDKIIITGGNGAELANLIEEEMIVIPELVFHGLQCYSAI
jgi:type III pantothenate kinase